MRRKAIFWSVTGLVLAAIVAVIIYLSSLMCIITGYAAKNLASAVFISGREQDDVENLDLNFSFIRFNHNTIDYENKTVTSRFLWGKSTAVYIPDYGVTLLRGDKANLYNRAKLPEFVSCDPDTISWPLGNMIPTNIDSADQQLTQKIEPISKAFVDDKAYNGTPFAFVVLHNGNIVAERYGYKCNGNTPLLSWSMAKSFTNAIVGLMVSDGIVDINVPMDIPEWQNDERKDITLNDIMQMQSGLEWNEDYGARSNVNLMLHREEDMGYYALDKSLKYRPGTFWYYSSGSTNIVMRYLRGKFDSDEDFYAYIGNRLFAPLGIRDVYFETDMSGTPVGSSYLYTTARNFARFGLLYLNDGMFAGQRILPESWVKYTRTPASASAKQYGSFFWLNEDRHFPDVPEDMYSCNGHDGQQIFIIPSKDLVVVILGYSPKPDHEIDFNRLLRDIIQNI